MIERQWGFPLPVLIVKLGQGLNSERLKMLAGSGPWLFLLAVLIWDLESILDIMESFRKGLDLHQPDWWITYANQQEMIDYARMCSDGRSGTVQAKLKMQRDVSTRLLMPVRAAIDAGFVEYKLPEAMVKSVLSSPTHGAKAMKCVYNPASDICRRVPETEASKLAGYGWRYVSKSEYKAWVVANARRGK